MRHALVAALVALAAAPGAASAETYDVVHREYQYVKNSAGQDVAVDLWLPARGTEPVPGRFPVVIEQSPYRDWVTPYPTKEDNPSNGGDPEEWARRGYVFVFADVPGTGGSQGTWCLWCKAQVDSAVSILEWAASQPFSNGRVGWHGNSYPGILGLLVAARRPPSLQALRIVSPYADLYDDLAYVGGVRRGEDLQVLASGFTGLDRHTTPYCLPAAECPEDAWVNAVRDRQLRPPADFTQQFLDHTDRDAYYAERSPLDTAASIAAPTLLVSGWEDMLGRGTVRMYEAIQARKRLVMGAATHVPINPAGGFNEVVAEEEVRWFDHWLKDTPNGVDEAPQARLYTERGPGWRSFETFPPSAVRSRSLYLGDQVLQETRPNGGDETQPIDPGSGRAGGRWLLRISVPDEPGEFLSPDQPGDQRAEEPSVLTYRTPPLERDLELTGSPTAVLRAATSAGDTQLNVRLIDESPEGTPDGFAYLVTGGWRLASKRGSLERRTPVTPGEPFDATVNVFPLSYVFKKGHRLRVDVAFADAPRFEAPTDSGTTTIFRGPSRIDLPVAGPAGSLGCSDRTPPRSRIVRRRSGVARRGSRRRELVLRGRASDRDCGGVRTTPRRVRVRVWRRAGSRCRYLTRHGRLARPAACRRPRWLSAKARGGRFVLRRRFRIEPGGVRAVVQAIDGAGNRERRARRNSVRLRVR